MSLVIHTTGLSKSFSGKQVLKDVSFQVEKGVTTGLVGHNGAGKTTLFSLLSGFLKPTEGSVEVLGCSPADPILSNRFSVLPQDAGFVHGIKVGNQLARLAELQGFSSKEAKREAVRVLEIVNLKGEWGQTPDNLSHGMRKRIAIAQSFIGEPELILLDEPTAGLDPESAKNIRNYIRDKQRQATFVISSHNMEDIEDLCQDILLLKAGQLTHQESIANLTARTTVLTFKMEQEVNDEIKQIISQISSVTKVESGKTGERRLTVFFSSSEKDALIEIEILKCLATSNLKYREMIKGERLADKVLEMSV